MKKKFVKLHGECSFCNVKVNTLRSFDDFFFTNLNFESKSYFLRFPSTLRRTPSLEVAGSTLEVANSIVIARPSRGTPLYCFIAVKSIFNFRLFWGFTFKKIQTFDGVSFAIEKNISGSQTASGFVIMN